MSDVADTGLVVAFAVGALLVLAVWQAPGGETVLTWYVPVVDTVMITAFGLAAVLGAMDAALHRSVRSMPLAVAAGASALLWIPHLVFFPGVLPEGWMEVGPQTAAVMFHLVHIGTPALLAAALVWPQRPGAEPQIARAAAATVAASALAIGIGVAAADVVPDIVVDGRFTGFSRVLTYLSLGPIAAALWLLASGRRGDERVSRSVSCAIVLLGFETVGEVIVPGRFVPGWYLTNLLRVLPAAVLVAGQLRLHAGTVRQGEQNAAALAASEERYRTLAETATDLIARVDPQTGRLTYVSPSVQAMLGFAPDELVGRPFDVLLAPDETARPGQLPGLVDGEVRTLRGFRLRTADGGLRWFDSTSRAITSGTGAVEIRVSAHDVTERIEAVQALAASEEALRASEATRQASLDALEQGVALSDLAGNVHLLNRAGQALLGYSAAELADLFRSGKWETYREDGAVLPPAERPLRHTMDTGEPVRDAIVAWRARTGRLVTLRVATQPVFTAEGELTGVVTAFADITNERRAERERMAAAADLARSNAELARSNAHLEDFAAIAAHDLRSPLATIGGFAQLLATHEPLQDDETAAEFARYILSGVGKMQRLIDDLLAFASVGARTEREPCDLGRIADDVRAMLAADIVAARAEVTIGALPTVTGDARQLHQLLQNLVANALKFRRADAAPAISITSSVDGRTGESVVSVADNGIGIDAGARERVFKMFQRLHSSSEYPGTGIGLAICRRVVENHEGRIWIDETPGGGTTFRFTLGGACAP